MIVLLEYIDLFYDLQITIIKQRRIQKIHLYLENQHSVQHV